MSTGAVVDVGGAPLVKGAIDVGAAVFVSGTMVESGSGVPVVGLVVEGTCVGLFGDAVVVAGDAVKGELVLGAMGVFVDGGSVAGILAEGCGVGTAVLGCAVELGDGVVFDGTGVSTAGAEVLLSGALVVLGTTVVLAGSIVVVAGATVDVEVRLGDGGTSVDVVPGTAVVGDMVGLGVEGTDVCV